MKTKHYLLAMCVLSITVFASCKKDKDEPRLNEKELLLTAHTWKVTSITVPKITNGEVDSTITTECSLLATVDFKTGHTFEITDPEKNCDNTAVPYSKGTWTFTSVNDVLTLKGSKEMSWKIATLSDTELKATFRDSISPEKIQIKTITLNK